MRTQHVKKVGVMENYPRWKITLRKITLGKITLWKITLDGKLPVGKLPSMENFPSLAGNGVRVIYIFSTSARIMTIMYGIRLNGGLEIRVIFPRVIFHRG